MKDCCVARRGVKPCFIKKLPQQVKSNQGDTLKVTCLHGSKGCRPMFVKSLPQKVLLAEKGDLRVTCLTGSMTEAGVEEVRKKVELAGKNIRQDKPMPPSAIKVTNLSATSVIITWEPPLDDGGSPIVQYILEKRDSGSASWEILTSLPGHIRDCELENLTIGKEYFIRIRSESKLGYGDPIEFSEAVKAHGVQNALPTRPGQPQIIEIGEDSIHLTWELPDFNGGSPVDQYILEQRELHIPRKVHSQRLLVPPPPYTVQNLVEGSQYEFRIYAQNSAGIGPPSPMSKSVVCRSPEWLPPTFLSEIEDVAVEEGDRANMQCHVDGRPFPNVSWFKNMREVFDGYKHKVSQDGTLCKMSVINVGPDDCGEVECRAVNIAGTVSIRAELGLQVPAQLKPPSQLQEGLHIHKGHKMKVRIPFIGRPRPKVTWIKDGKVLRSNGRHEMTADKGSVNLIMHAIEKNDKGRYIVQVENDLGRDQVCFDVIVTDRPDPPEVAPFITDITNDRLCLQWQPPQYDGGSPITAYVVEKWEKDNDNWMSLGPTCVPNIVIGGLQQGHEYKFRVHAENQFGRSDVGSESDLIKMEEQPLTINYDKLVTPTGPTKQINMDKVQNDLSVHYIICEELGKGPNGTVHRVLERSTGRSFVAKTIDASPTERSSIFQEAVILSESQHPKIVNLHDIVETTDGKITLVMELLAGGDILQYISSKDTSYTELHCINIMRQICQAVSHLHKHNVIHMEIRPENILFRTSQSLDIKLVDLGMAQILNPDKSVRVFFGSAEFSAPEIISYQPVGFASDVWSLGVCAFILLTGYSPFLGKTIQDTFLNITHGVLDFESPLWSNVSQSARDWIMKALAKSPQKRMTIGEALSHPWLSGESEAKIKPVQLDVLGHSKRVLWQKWRETMGDVIGMGRLAHQCPVHRRLTHQGVVFERDIHMELCDQAPQVVVELESIEAYVGTVARLKCRFLGQPEPSVHWMHEGVLLKDIPRFESMFKRGLAMLTIYEVHEEDAGQFSCTAINDVGSCTTVGELSVQEVGFRRRSLDIGPSSRRSVSHEMDTWSIEQRRSVSMDRTSSDRPVTILSGLPTTTDSNIPPVYTLPLFDQALREGKKCTLSVLVACKLEPDILWFHNDREVLPSAKYHIERCRGGMHKLKIQAVTKNDEGKWKCFAANAYGQAVTSCFLTIIDDESEMTAPTFDLHLSKSMVFEGNNTTMECKATGNPTPQIVWSAAIPFCSLLC